MTAEDKKAWLGRYRAGRMQLNRLREQRARVKSFGERVTVRANAAASGGGTSDRVQLAIERMSQIDMEIADILNQLPTWEREAGAAISALENVDHRRIMAYYYIECLSWYDVAELSGYYIRHVMRLHKNILSKIETWHTMSP